LVDGVISLELSLALQRQPLGNGGSQRGLAMVDVTNGADVNMGLGSFKFLLSHLKILLSIFKICWVQCGFSQHCLFYRIMEGKSIPFSLRLGLIAGLHDLIPDILRDLHVVAGLHGVLAAALGAGAQIGGIAEHLGQGHVGVDLLGA
ncbi:Fe-S cluster assembly scaffold protein NifU, partial [Dysosmobacter welbionis]